jgi:GAF domain-containing protein
MDELRSLVTSHGDRTWRARQAAEYICAARGYHWVGLYDVTPSHITAIAWTGDIAPAYPTFPRSQGINGAAVAAGRPIIVQDVRNDPRYLTAFGSTRAEAIFPVRGLGESIVGTIDVESDQLNAFGTQDEAFLTQCAAVLTSLWS